MANQDIDLSPDKVQQLSVDMQDLKRRSEEMFHLTAFEHDLHQSLQYKSISLK